MSDYESKPVDAVCRRWLACLRRAGLLLEEIAAETSIDGDIVGSESRAEAADADADAGLSWANQSFTAGTMVALAAGGVAAISAVTVGTMVTATDPHTGRTQAEPVEKVWCITTKI